VTRLFIVPRVDEFEDNYVGQWLSVTGTTEPHEEVADNCAFANWEAGTSIAYDALLLDKRSEVPLSISMVAYGDSEPDEVREDTVFIVNSAEVCNDQWIGLSCESVPSGRWWENHRGRRSTRPRGRSVSGAGRGRCGQHRHRTAATVERRRGVTRGTAPLSRLRLAVAVSSTSETTLKAANTATAAGSLTVGEPTTRSTR